MIGQNVTSAAQTEVDHCALGHELECFIMRKNVFRYEIMRQFLCYKQYNVNLA